MITMKSRGNIMFLVEYLPHYKAQYMKAKKIGVQGGL